MDILGQASPIIKLDKLGKVVVRGKITHENQVSQLNNSTRKHRHLCVNMHENIVKIISQND